MLRVARCEQRPRTVVVLDWLAAASVFVHARLKQRNERRGLGRRAQNPGQRTCFPLLVLSCAWPLAGRPLGEPWAPYHLPPSGPRARAPRQIGLPCSFSVCTEQMSVAFGFDVSKVAPRSDEKPLPSLPANTLPFEKRRVKVAQTTLPLVDCASITEDSFVNAVAMAYNRHLPLGLDTDALWLRVVQGLGQYVNSAPDSPEIRSLLVRHDGKMKLVAVADEEQDASGWAESIGEMARKIGANLADADWYDLLLAPFSETTQTHHTALCCTLMHATQQFFDFECQSSCGIPRVTLYGTPVDYDALVERAERLAAKVPGLDWWFERLLPVLRSIRETAHGKPDVEWWERIMSLDYPGFGDSGEPSISGWVLAFVPFYCDESGKQHKACECLTFSEVQPALFEAPFRLITVSGDAVPMAVVAGFFGVAQDPATLEVRAVVGWAVVHTTKD